MKKINIINGMILLVLIGVIIPENDKKAFAEEEMVIVEDAVSVDEDVSVEEDTDLSENQIFTVRLPGVVEPQRIESISILNGMKVRKTYVKEGDLVEIGTRLFEYDVDEIKDRITQTEIELENLDITIESSKAQIEQLIKEREKVAETQKMSYSLQIKTTENNLKRTQYEKKGKKNELKSLKKQVKNSVVKSPVEGKIKKINTAYVADNVEADITGQNENEGFINIMLTGNYRVKGIVTQKMVSQIAEGDSVLVHSRVDENMTWNGTVASVDLQSTVTTQQDSDIIQDNAEKYTVYVELEDARKLMLGQHVYITQNEESGLEILEDDALE